MSSYTQLSQAERYYISQSLLRKISMSQIAREMKRDKSTISRELGRNRTRSDNGYRAEKAHSYATARRRRERRGSHFNAKHWEVIYKYLRLDWSPEQIANVLKTRESFSMSHETMYKHILQDKKNGGSLYKHLRIMPKLRRKRYNSRDSRGVLRGKRHISERPSIVETRKELGHWEGDTIMGPSRFDSLLTLVERKSGFVIIKKLKNQKSAHVAAAAIRAISRHEQKFKTLTLDNGTEFHRYQVIEDACNLKVYFATPYHSWERGTNENTNGLIRQYVPKKMSMKDIDQIRCNWIAHRLNSRPRKRHGFKTPLEVYCEDG
jgi:IS30 family transposase